jgi:formamidopyrimidine-DNA glycosylase
VGNRTQSTEFSLAQLYDEQGVTAEQLTAALLGRTLKHAGRKGKQLWLELDGDGPHPLFHLGMTGNLSVEGIEAPTYKSFKVCLPYSI